MKVLVAIDESEFADLVADFVSAHSWPACSTFVILHVEPSLLPVSAALPPDAVLEVRENRDKAARELLARVASRIDQKDHKFTLEVAEGDPKRQIIAWGEKLNADVIVLGSHGRSGLARFMLGSVSLAVATEAHCSVMIVRPAIKVASEHQIEIKEKEFAS